MMLCTIDTDIGVISKIHDDDENSILPNRCVFLENSYNLPGFSTVSSLKIKELYEMILKFLYDFHIFHEFIIS